MRLAASDATLQSLQISKREAFRTFGTLRIVIKTVHDPKGWLSELLHVSYSLNSIDGIT